MPKFMPTFAKNYSFPSEMRQTQSQVVVYIEINGLMYQKVLKTDVVGVMYGLVESAQNGFLHPNTTKARTNTPQTLCRASPVIVSATPLIGQRVRAVALIKLGSSLINEISHGCR
jgi:hypothetical protein